MVTNSKFSSLILIAGLLSCLQCAGGQARHPLDTRSAPMLGHENAPRVVVVFSDFQCSFCKRAAAEFERAVAANPTGVAVYFKHFPLRRHRYAEAAARAAVAADRQGRFWEMHDLIFAYAGALHDGIFNTLAQEIGLDVSRFESDMADPAVAKRVADDRAEGEAVGLTGTPFFILDGAPYLGRFSDLLAELAPSERTK